MNDESPATSQLSPHTSARRTGLIEFALAVGGFGIGAGEFAMMGLMPEVARSLQVAEPRVGHLISAYALGVVVGAPLIAILGARFHRRHLLLMLMAFFAVGNLASALAPGYHAVMLARFVAGLPHGAYFGIAMLVAATIAGPGQRAKAVSRVMLGLTSAILIGNPLVIWLGQLTSWRVAYALVGLIALITVVLLAWHLPLDRNETRNRPMQELAAFREPQVWLTLMIGAIGFAGMFCVFSYLAPTMTNVTGLSAHWVPIGVAAFGAGSVIGNVGGGWLFDRYQFGAVALILIWSIAVLLLFPLAAHSVWSILPACVAVGSMVGLAPPLQTRLMDVAADAQTLAAASNHAAFNVANALGPWLGGLAITAGWGWTSTGDVGAAMALGGLGFFVWAWMRDVQPAGARTALSSDNAQRATE